MINIQNIKSVDWTLEERLIASSFKERWKKQGHVISGIHPVSPSKIKGAIQVPTETWGDGEILSFFVLEKVSYRKMFSTRSWCLGYWEKFDAVEKIFIPHNFVVGSNIRKIANDLLLIYNEEKTGIPDRETALSLGYKL